MSEKRRSPDSRTDEQPTNDSDLLHQGDHAKRMKLTSLSDTTLQDLPLELIEIILVRAIVMEVEEMHLAKSAWKEKADRVMSRLKTVCPDWSNILTTNFFQNELYRTLDRTAEKKIRLEIVQLARVPHFKVYDAVTLKDELFILGNPKSDLKFIISVYDRNNLTELKDVIALHGFYLKGMTACNVSNCLYLFNFTKCVFREHIIVWRITKEDEHQFRISPLISNKWKPSHQCIAASGSIILVKEHIHVSGESTEIVAFDANGSMQHKMTLSSDLSSIRKLIPKSNGNLVLVSTKLELHFRTKLTEINMDGTILRQYQSSLEASSAVCLADRHGRIVIVKDLKRIELLDNEFNLLNAICPSLDADVDPFYYAPHLHYNSDRNEFVAITESFDSVVSIFRFAEN